MPRRDHYDVAIVGAGLAGLSLARHLLIHSTKRILLLDRRPQIPPPRQKVGESTVQLSAYYYAKVLDLEEHLLSEHYLKYNLRFYWKNATRSNQGFEDYGHVFIRGFSNIACYQLDRNRFEAELLRLNLARPGFTFIAPAEGLRVSLQEPGPHVLQLQAAGEDREVTADWVVDTSGRNKVLNRTLHDARPNPIHHGTSFLWVEGLVDIEKLTDLSPREVRLQKSRQATGHSPFWLATNHFMGEGFWFWVIPLHGKTSLGLVFDNRLLPWERVATPQRLIQWVCEEFPLFARDLPQRRVLDQGFFRDYSYDCAQTISEAKWARSGEAGRFTDPLYSPGSDLISLHNTLIAEAILDPDEGSLSAKCRLYERLMRGLYEGTVPTYAVSYDTLGDQEAFALKYTWELTVYFAFYVFPFINGFFASVRFIPPFLARFARLGALNRALQAFISDYFQWKKERPGTGNGPSFIELMQSDALRSAERTFYSVGVTEDEGLAVLDSQLAGLRQLARQIVARITASVRGDEALVTNQRFLEAIDLEDLRFDPMGMWEGAARGAGERRPGIDAIDVGGHGPQAARLPGRPVATPPRPAEGAET